MLLENLPLLLTIAVALFALSQGAVCNMARRTSFNGTSKTIAAGVAQTLTWTPSDIPSARVVAYHLALQGAGNDLDDITRIRVSANGSNIYNVTPLQLRAFWQAFSGGGIKYPATSQALTIPFVFLDAPTPEQADTCQFPVGAQAQVEVTLAATAAAGVALLGWTETTIQPEFFPRLLASVLNIPASAALQRYNFQESGVVRGFQIPHAGVSRCKLTLAGQDFTYLPSLQFNALANLGDMLYDAESLYGEGPGSAGPVAAIAAAPFSRVSAGIPAPMDSSYLELETGAGWGGVANEMALYAVARNR
jgi:hypothetical protein